MKPFTGFPAKMQFTPLPDLFFSALLPQMSDIAELKTTLHFFNIIYHKRGYPRFVSYQELLSSTSLMRSLKETARQPDEALRKGLELATKRGTILHLALEKDGATEDVYFLNTESDRQAMGKIKNGELVLKGLSIKPPVQVQTEELPDIYTLYEENIGMLTPMVAEELKEAEKLYPRAWIIEAIKEATNHNKRKWSYIAAILERWASEGKSDGTYQRDFKKTDPDKYFKGKYGHLVQR
jgi:DnaD/phage-associated family protein